MRIAFSTRLAPDEHTAWIAALRAARPQDQWCEDWTVGERFDAAVVAQPPAGALQGLRGLKLIQSLWAGVERLLADPTLPEGVPIARMVDPSMTAAMAESAAWAVLSLHRRFFDYAALQAHATWQQLPQRRAAAVAVLVLGAGAMGMGVAQRLRSLGYSVRAWRRGNMIKPAADAANPAPVTSTSVDSASTTARPGGASMRDSAAGVTVLSGYAALLQALEHSDIVINLLPLTMLTRGMLNARFFAGMRAGSALVNFGRGGHVVEGDLLAALDSGHLSRTVLDVFAEEPLPSDHPFWHHPRITVLPHVAALTDMDTAATVVADNLSRLERGESPLHLVDGARGY